MFRVPAWSAHSVSATLRRNKMKWIVTMDDVQAAVDRQMQVSTQMTPSNIFSQYQTIENLNLYLDHLNHAYPTQTTLFDIGQTFEGNPIRGIKIHSGANTTGSKEMVFHGGIHAREWISAAVVTYIATQLLKRSNETLLHHFTYSIIPVLNM
jgi:hypothetical protein